MGCRYSWWETLLRIAPSAVPLELCLPPLPFLSISGEPLTGVPLRLAVGRDRYVLGDSLARETLEFGFEVTWRRQRCASQDGEPVHVGSELTFTPTADDVDCLLAAGLRAADGRRFDAQALDA